MNVGKIFEKNFKEAVKTAKNGEVFIYRIKDTDSSYNHTATSKYTNENLCDYFMFYEGIFYALELKTTCYPSISFETENNNSRKMIGLHQIKGLTKLVPYQGIIAGFVFNFRNEEKEEEETFFMRIEDFNRFTKESEKKSINKGDIVIYGGIPIESRKKRKNFTYNIDQMIEDIRKDFLEEDGDEK